MKRLLIALGTIFLMIIIFGAIGIGIIAYKGTALDKESKDYVDSSVPAIVSAWDKQELLSRASPEFMQVVTSADLDKLYGMYRRLGKLKEYQGSEGQSNMSVTSQHGKVISAAYTTKATFDSGPATIKISIIKHGDKWQIIKLYVESEVFLQHQ
jgi:hypothetical protein